MSACDVEAVAAVVASCGFGFVAYDAEVVDLGHVEQVADASSLTVMGLRAAVGKGYSFDDDYVLAS